MKKIIINLRTLQLVVLIATIDQPARCIPGISWLKEQYSLMKGKEIITSASTEITPILPEKNTTLMMYQLMQDVHNIFARYNIPYWVDGGTLLGAVRNKGIIPWDDDLDICIDKNDVKSVLALEPFFNSIGYEMFYPLHGVIKISPKAGKDSYYLGIYKLKTPHIDILFTENRNDKIYFSPTIFTYIHWILQGDYAMFGHRNGDEIYITKSELYPLKEYQFGEIKVMGANKPESYLQCLYGDDYMDVGYQWHNHQNGLQKIQAGKITLTQENKIPAQPTGPLRETRL